MSVYSLSCLAKHSRKDERTIRRWCIAGRVPGAFQTKGGHWRVRAGSLDSIKPDVAGFSRDRGGDPWAGVLRAGAALKKAMSRGRGLAVSKAASALVESWHQYDSFEMSALSDRLWEVAAADASGATFDQIIRLAVRVWERQLAEDGSWSDASLAALAGMPRRSFFRHFGKLVTPAEDRREAAGRRHGSIETTAAVKAGRRIVAEPVTFHPSATAGEVRRMSAGLRTA